MYLEGVSNGVEQHLQAIRSSALQNDEEMRGSDEFMCDEDRKSANTEQAAFGSKKKRKKTKQLS